jgi:hypothetical protein
MRHPYEDEGLRCLSSPGLTVGVRAGAAAAPFPATNPENSLKVISCGNLELTSFSVTRG